MIYLEGISGFWNIQRGLERWRKGLSLRWKGLGETAGYGGVDVLIWGDSFLEGAGGSTKFWSSPGHLLKVKLQERFNPPGVPGGYGFCRMLSNPNYSGANSWPVITATNGNYWDFDDKWQNQYIYGFTGYAKNFMGNARAKVIMDGTDALASFKKSGVSEIEPVWYADPNANIMNWSVSSTNNYAYGSTGDRGNGSFSGAGTANFGRRYGGKLAVTLDPKQYNCFSWGIDGNGVVQPIGAFMYNGDTDCGVRVHNFSMGGYTATDFCEGTSAPLAQQLADNVFNATWGAKNPRLVITDFITNDTWNTLDKFTTNYAAFMDFFISRGACVLAVIPPNYLSGADGLAKYKQYRDVIYTLAKDRPDVAIIDLWEILGEPDKDEWNTDLNWLHTDAEHFNDSGQAKWADFIMQALTN